MDRMLRRELENYVNQGRANLTTIKNQMEGENKEERRDSLQLTVINIPISV